MHCCCAVIDRIV
eukprot:IDg2064t1